MNISWSAIQTFLTCQRRYELTYIEHLSKPSGDEYNLKLGSAFHEGIEFVLKQYDDDVADYFLPEVDVRGAVAAALRWVKEDTIPNKQVYDPASGGQVPDTYYYQTMAKVRNEVVPLLEYHIPLMGIGTKYVPVIKGDLFPIGTVHPDDFTELALEWKLKYPIGDDVFITGIVDAVLRDVETGEYVIVDWKTRGVFPNDDLALVDGQVHLYAAVLNAMGANISRVAMWQFSTKLPSPASISAKNHRPNTGAASYDTTWDHWVATLPPNISPEKYEEEIRPKLKQNEDYQRIVWGVVTSHSTEMMYRNVLATVEAIQNARESDHGFPAVLGSNACKWCPFLQLCANGLRYGGDVEEFIDRYYVRTEKE